MYQRRLTCTAAAHNSEDSPAPDLKVDLVQNLARFLPISGVSEADVLEAHAIGKSAQVFSARLLTNVVLKIHELENLRRRSQRLLKIIIEQRELAHGIVKAEYRGDERNEDARRHLIVRNSAASQLQQQRDPHHAHNIHERRTDGRCRYRF